MRSPISILAASLVAGCAASTPDAARQLGPERRYTFQVDVDYQTAYRRILETERKCNQYPLGTAMQMVNGDLYPDTKSGSITVGLYGALGPSIYQVIDVKALDGGKTEVVATFPTGPVEKLGSKVRAWSVMDNEEC